MIAHRSSFPSNEGSARLAAYMAEAERVAQFTHVELAQGIIEEVLSAVEGRDEILVIEMLSRFEEMSGIVRNDDGEVVETGDEE